MLANIIPNIVPLESRGIKYLFRKNVVMPTFAADENGIICATMNEIKGQNFAFAKNGAHWFRADEPF